MNRLRRPCLALVLTLTFALSAFAGEIECGVASPPPPPPTTSATPTDGAVDAFFAFLESLLPSF